MQLIKLERGKTLEVAISLGFNVSSFEFLCEIRESEDPGSSIIATLEVTFKTDGKDGHLIATLDDSITSEIIEDTGWMVLKRVGGAFHLPVFESPLEVEISDPVLV